ncbi:hypothetical protein [Kitasatospora sp. GP82]|uniref:hypothetical protein n=1 Tax=Kitasatospora sp. GP82 TaxID=3035089 RepID=UPI002475A7FA|nr:hypothetical protein [Kitasatospora sp. GP82]MDH6125286.1 hypothetical protein [Kitasatospora sp. GP82]
MRVQRTLVAGAAVATVLVFGSPAVNAVTGLASPSDRKAAPGGPGAADDQQVWEERGRKDDRREDGRKGDGREDGRREDGRRGDGSHEEGRKPRGGVHTGGGGLSASGGLASGVALLGGGLAVGAYTLRRRKVAGGVV